MVDYEGPNKGNVRYRIGRVVRCLDEMKNTAERNKGYHTDTRPRPTDWEEEYSFSRQRQAS